MQANRGLSCGIIQYQRVVAFLSSKGRKSTQTAATYKTALKNLDEFIALRYKPYNVETILGALKDRSVDVYSLLDGFVGYLLDKEVSASAIRVWLFGIKSYLGYCDIDIVSQKFRHRVVLPSLRKEDERPLDKGEIRKIVLATNSPKMRAYLLFLACAGPRAVEALAVRVSDIDFKKNKVYMQAKYSKNKLAREIYITDEAAHYLKKWMERKKAKGPDELVFSVIGTSNPQSIYGQASSEFRKILDCRTRQEKARFKS